MAVKFKDTININGQYTLPSTDGSVGQVLVTDGLGNLTFTSESIAGSADSAESTHLNVKNTSGASIAKGTPVYVTGSVGATDKLEIAPADASNASHMPAIGLLESTLANNGEGFAVQGGLLKGLVTDTIDGSASTANDTVYVKAGGGLTLTKPTGSTNFIQNIAKVARVHSSNGSLIVSSILRANDVPNLSTGKIWVGDSNTIESTVVHIDETNGRVGIGTTSPSSVIHIYKDAHPNAALAKFENPSGEAIVQLKSQNDTLGVIEFADSEDGNVGAIQYSHADNSMRFKTNDAERMRIDSSGVVQVRNQTPTIQLYNTDTSLSLNQTLGDIDFYQSDASDQGVGTVAKIRAVNNSTFAGYGELAFHTGNATTLAERMRIDSSGRVGMGITSPSSYDANADNLVIGSVGANDKNGITIVGGDTDGRGAVYFADTTQNSAGFITYFHSNNSMLFGTSDTERMRIDSSGNLLVGDTGSGLGSSGRGVIEINGSSSSILGLKVGGTVKTYLFQNGDNVELNNTANGYLALKTNAAERVRIDSSGNVGIGTDNPNFLLTLNAPTGGALQWQYNGGNYLRIEADSGGGSYYAAAGLYHRFFTSGAERMRIDSSGNVGIGTTSPSGKLHIKPDANSNYVFTGTSTSGYNLNFDINDTGVDIGTNSSIRSLNLQTNSLDRLTISGGGNVGINVTDPDAQLEIVNSSGGSYRLGYGGGTDSYFDSENFYIRSGNGGSNKLVVNSSGRVGIGTTSPTSTLHLESASSPVLTIKDTTNSVTLLAYSQNSDSHIGTYSNHSLIFDTNSTERMRIDSNGITSVYNDFVLDYGSPEMYFKTGATHYRWMLAAQENVDAAFEITPSTTVGGTTYSTPVAVFKATGNVGIGTTSPSQKLTVVGNAYIAGGLLLLDDNQPIQWGNSQQKIIGNNSGYLQFITSNSEAMRIDSSGRIGIGMTPSNYSGYMLQVNGGAQCFMSFGNSTTGTGALNGLVIGNDSTGADIYQREAQPIRFHTSNIERMRIVSGGGIQIPNVNATNEIQFTGSEYTNVYSATTAGFDIGTNSTNGTSYLRLLTENAERLRIDSSGRVGIGTTNPGVALDVVGAIRATGDVTAFHSSDERLKANKKIIENAADKIEQIGGYEFDWLPKEGVHINEGHDIGVIAQEVEKVIPEVVVTRDNGYKAVKYEKLVPLLIEAVKELSEKVKILENK